MIQLHPMTRRHAIATAVASTLGPPSVAGAMRPESETSRGDRAHWPGYAKAIVIDACGGPADTSPATTGPRR